MTAAFVYGLRDAANYLPVHRSQHIFINPDCPRSAYGMAYNCLASPDNAITFNDGYHIEHHLNPKTHWSQLPSCYINNWEEHAKQQGAYLCPLMCMK